MSEPTLSVRDLEISYGGTPVVRKVSFEVDPGEIVALVGPSGAGKSSIIAAIMEMIPPTASYVGHIQINGTYASDVGADQWRNRMVGLVPQNPFSWFNPMIRMRRQLREVVRVDRSIGRRESRRRAEELLQQVGFDDVKRVGSLRPESLSGGMRQRCAIAAAVAHSPPLLVADEPTSALDPESRRHVLELLKAYRDAGRSVLLVSHETAVVRDLADRVLSIEDGYMARPRLYGDEEPVQDVVVEPEPEAVVTPATEPPTTAGPMLVAKGLDFAFPGQSIVSSFELSVREAETVAVVGTSGRGKSTLCRMLAGLLTPDNGLVEIDGECVMSMSRTERAAAVQLMFQDVRGSLDPRYSARASVSALLRSPALSREERKERVEWAFTVAGLEDEFRDRSPAEMSGGQAQRVALARAIVLRPKVLLLDEPFSALDATTRTALIARLRYVQKLLGLTVVAVLHDEEVIEGFANRTVRLD